MKNCLFIFTTALLFGAVALHTNLSAQTMPDHQPKVYVDDNDEIFWNKKLPFYIKLSTSPDEDAKDYRLQSKVTPKYADPSYFDTEGVNYIRTRWAVDPETGKTITPQQEVLWEVYADGIPARTSASLEGKQFRKDGKVFIGKNAALKLSADDEVSGIETIYYSLNLEKYIPYTGPISFESEKEYKVKYYTTDRVGNVEPAKEVSYMLDLTAPQTQTSIHGQFQEKVFSPDVSISLEATDQLTGVDKIYYAIDGGQEKVYAERIYVGWMEEGEHTITYYSEDQVANREEKNTLTFFLDKTPPLLTREIIGDSYYADGKEYSSGRSRLKLTAIDNKAGVKEVYYSINGGEFQLYEKPVTLNLKETKLSIEAYATDKVGNKTTTDKNQERFVHLTYSDLIGPKLSHDFIGKTYAIQDTIYISSLTQIKLTGKDAESGLSKISYSLDGAAEVDYAEPFAIPSPGLHEISFFGYDNVKNRNMNRFFCFVDNEGPEVFIRFSLPKKRDQTLENKVLDVYSGQTVLFLSATDQKVGYEEMYYTVNGLPEQTYKGVIKDLKKGVENQISIKAVDKLGNTKESTVNFYLEN